MTSQIILNGLIAGLLYSLVALGFSLIYSATRIFHVAHGAIYTAAAYFFLAGTLILSPIHVAAGLTFPLVIAFTLASTSIFAAVSEVLVYRPLESRGASALVTFISSLGIYIVSVNLIAILFGNETKLLNPNNEIARTIGPVVVTRVQLIQIGVSVLAVLAVLFVIKATSLGRNIRALSDSPTLISVLGADPDKIRMLVFIVGSLLAASSALLKGLDVGVQPNVGLPIVLTATVAVIIGGVGSHVGAVLSALILGVTQNLVAGFFSAEWKDAVIFVLFIAVLVFRREGLLATQLRLEER